MGRGLLRVVSCALGALAASGCEVPVKKTVTYCFVSDMQFDIDDGSRTRLGQGITPWHWDLGDGDIWFSGSIRGDKTQRESMPTSLTFEMRHYNSTGSMILETRSQVVPVRRSGKFKLKKTPFQGFEFQQFEQYEIFVTPTGGSIRTGSEFSVCHKYRRGS